MGKNQPTARTEVGQGNIENLKSPVKPGQSRTDPQKVKKEIQKDVSAGIGAMTSREAGSMRD